MAAENIPETSKWEVAHRVLDAVVKIKAENKKNLPLIHADEPGEKQKL